MIIVIIIANWIPTYGCAFSLENIHLPLNVTDIYDHGPSLPPASQTDPRTTALNNSNRLSFSNLSFFFLIMLTIYILLI